MVEIEHAMQISSFKQLIIMWIHVFDFKTHNFDSSVMYNILVKVLQLLMPRALPHENLQ